jgi:ankyrin repeat protein/putative intracellular protease/amidase
MKGIENMGQGKVAILIESDFYEHEIWYYHYRFLEAGIEVKFLSRLWGQPSLTFTGHEYRAPLVCDGDLEAIDDQALAEFDALIVPSGIVADRLRYTEDLSKTPPAAALLQRAFANPNVLKGIICHGLWLSAPVVDVVLGRRLTCHPNLHGDALAYGAVFVDEDLVEDGDLITARTGGHAHLLAAAIIRRINERRERGAGDQVAAPTGGESEGARRRGDDDQRLLSALSAGVEADALTALAAGANPNARDADGLTALMLACGRGLAVATEALLKAGADPFAKDPHAGASALHKAAQHGSIECARLLLRVGARVDEVATSTGHTPLMEALWFKQAALVQEFLLRGATLAARTRYGFTLDDLVEVSMKINQQNRAPIQVAAAAIEERRADDDARSRQLPLIQAVQAGDANAVRAALAAGVDLEARTPVLGRLEDGHTALLIAALQGNEALVRLLVDAGADVNASEPTFLAVPLHKAAYNGHLGVLKQLVRAAGIDLDRQGGTNGYTALHDAVWHGFMDCAAVLLEAGARADLPGHDGKTAAHLALELHGRALMGASA